MEITTEQKLIGLLTALGDSPEDVAAFLEGQGIKGWRKDTRHCPVANFLRTQFGTTHVVVTEGTATVVTSHEYLTPCTVWLPKPVLEFIKAFDHGDYKSLDG